MNKISAKYSEFLHVTNIIKCLWGVSGKFQEFMKFYEYRGNLRNISGISMRNGLFKKELLK
jgi:hypothetical protein